MRASLLACAALAVLLAACGDDSSGPDDEVVIQMRDNSFAPATQTIERGTRVRWQNTGAVQHNTTSSAATPVWSSSNLNPGGSFSFTFNTSGTFAYVCTLHPGMAGTIVVQ